MRHRPLPLALGLALSASVAVGCAEEEKLPARNPATAASSSATGTGGSGAGSGEGGSGAGADGGAGGGGGDATGGSGAESPCVGNVAFQAVGATFQFPTPKDLYSVLNDLTYDPSTHPFGVLLMGAPSADVQLASSAIDAGAYVADAPTWGPVVLDASGFDNDEEPLATGTMRIATDGDPIDVPLRNIKVIAETNADCSSASVSFDAIIPVSAADIELPTDKGPRTIEQLAGAANGPMGGNEEGWNMRAKFDAEPTSFDFGSAP